MPNNGKKSPSFPRSRESMRRLSNHLPMPRLLHTLLSGIILSTRTLSRSRALLPSPAGGRGAGGEGARKSADSTSSLNTAHSDCLMRQLQMSWQAPSSPSSRSAPHELACKPIRLQRRKACFAKPRFRPACGRREKPLRGLAGNPPPSNEARAGGESRNQYPAVTRIPNLQ